jgi:hypothetical protein
MADNYSNQPMQDTQNIFFGTCIDNEDPDMLGRIRVYPTHENIQSLKSSNQFFDENSKNPSVGPWSDKDPFIFLPLLPYFVNQVPQKGENVMIFYFNNKRMSSKNKFYVIGNYSSPTTIKFEEQYSSRTNYDGGNNNSKVSLPKIKNNVDGKYFKQSSKGVFAEPIDISINGRDTADLIIKKDEVLLRAGKHKDFKTGEIPDANDKRAFLQLTKLGTKKTFGDPKSLVRLEQNTQQLKYLIEYDVYNPESQPKVFRGDITIYKLPEIDSYQTKTNVFDLNSEITGVTLSKAKVIKIDNPLPIDEFAKYVRETLTSFKDNPEFILPGVTNIKDQQFPFYYRPTPRIRKILKSISDPTNVSEMSNMMELINSIRITTTDLYSGYGLVLDKKVSVEIPFTPKKEIYTPESFVKEDTTVGLMGANQLYFISHDSTIPGKGTIDLTNTIYGVDSNKIYDEIEGKTSATVRGEELLELLESIVGFLVSHVHPYPLLPPSGVSLDGNNVDDLLKKMLEAYQKVLNKNIRIN